MENKKRCSWCKTKLYTEYHDKHWGKENHNELELFKLLCLESQSSGLGFSVILSKQSEYEKAFNFSNIKSIAKLSNNDIENIINNYNVIKNKKKIQAIVNNAQAYFKLVKTHKSLNDYLWSKVNYKISKNLEGATENSLSKQIYKEFKKFGFSFLGSVTIFSYLQAIGIYNDHQKECFMYKEIIE